MKLKWDRLSISLLVIMSLSVLAIFFYGNRYFLTPVKDQADQTTSLIDEQKALMATYPPEEKVLQEFKKDYEETWNFLPEGEMANQEMGALEKAANGKNVSLNQVLRIGEPQLIEDVGHPYTKSVYQVDMTSESLENLQSLVGQLTSFERIWNIYMVSFQKNEENFYQGIFMFELFYHVETPSEGIEY